MRSRKGFWLAAAAVACIVAGLFLVSGTMVALSLPIVVYLGVMGLFLEKERSDLEVERRISDTRIMAGDSLHIEVIVRNRGRRSNYSR